MNISDELRLAVETELETAYKIFCGEMKCDFEKPKLLLGTDYLFDFLLYTVGEVPARAVLEIDMLYDDRTNEIVVSDHMLWQDASERLFVFFHECGHPFHGNINPMLRGSKFQEMATKSKKHDEQMRGYVYSAASEGIAQYLAVMILLHGTSLFFETDSWKKLRIVASEEHQAWLKLAESYKNNDRATLAYRLSHDMSARCALGYQFIRRINPLRDELEKIILNPPETLDELLNPNVYCARLGI